MAANNTPNKNTALALNQKVAAGVDKYFSKVKSLTIGGTTYTPTTLKAVLTAENDASKSVDSTRAQLKQQVATHRKAKASAAALRSELRTYILGTSGKAAVQMLEDFGMSAPKTGNKTAQVKAEAVTKAKSTREARGTMGKNQTRSIHGAPEQPATTGSSPQGAPAVTPVPVVPAESPAQTTASHA